MASLFLDHNLSPQLGRLLRRAGHDARTARDLHYEQMPDAEILRAMAAVGRVIVTSDDDFVRLHRGADDHVGVLIVPQTPRADLPAVARMLSDILTTGHPRQNELWRLRPGYGWQLVP